MKNSYATFLDLLGVKHTKSFTGQYFNEHPHKYNLFGLSKMLSDYGVENAATRIEDKENEVSKIETPFIAHVSSDFVTVYLIAACLNEFQRPPDESYSPNPSGGIMQILSDRFEKGKPQKDEYFKEMGLNMEDSAIEDEFQRHEAWKEKTQLRATPTILINGFKIPESYKIEDLHYFTNLDLWS